MLKDAPTPVSGAEERSDEAPDTGGVPAGTPVPDPEVVARPTRRQFSPEYRLRILEEADRCTEPGEVGRVLRREGLYSSHLSAWRKSRRQGSLRGLTPNKRGPKPKRDPREGEVRALQARVAQLETELKKAYTIVEVQKKVAGLLRFSLKDGSDC